MPTINWSRDDLQREQTSSGFTADELHNTDLERGYNLGSLTDGLVAYYPFDDDADDGTTAIDSTRNRDVPIVGATHTTDSAVGDTAMSFDGTDDYIPLGLYLDKAISEITVTCWVKTTTDSQIVISHDRSEYYRLGINSATSTTGAVSLSLTSSGGAITDYSGNTRVDDGAWHHIGFTYNSGKFQIYVDGSVDASGSHGNQIGTGVTRYGFIADGSEASSFDGSRNQLYYTGDVDDARIYSRALSAPEIQALYELTSPHGSIVESDPREGIVSYWKLDGDATDSVGSNDGTVTGATFVDGFYDQCASFDGTDDIITVSDSPDLDPPTITVSYWMKPASTGASSRRRTVSKYTSNTTDQWESFIDTDDTVVWHNQVSDTHRNISSNTTITAGEWLFVLGITDGDGQMSIYVNGEKEGETSGETLNDNPHDLGIGASPQGDWYFDGEIDDVRVYNRPLNPAEVQQLYEYGKRKIPTESNL